MPAIWTRQTPWRQGHVLPAEAVSVLELGDDSVCVVVISHDCDLASDNLEAEPNVEVIIGSLAKGNGNYFHAKAPRTLHVQATRNGSDVVIELVATRKKVAPKSVLAAFSPDAAFSLSGRELATLRSWLSVRYNRTAFPDKFVDRLRASKVDDRLAKLVGKHGSTVSAVYFDVDEGVEVDHSDGSAYQLSIVLAHPAGDDPVARADEMDALAKEIEGVFASKHFDAASQKWNGVKLNRCIAISEDDLTVGQAKLLSQWRLEYMTLREEDHPGPVSL